jgi:autotransporter-associated beta strand protein
MKEAWVIRKLGRRGRRWAVLGVASWAACPLVARGGVPVQWDPSAVAGLQGGNGVWNTSNSNWDLNGVRRGWANGNGDTAVFGGAAGGAVTVGSAVTAGAIQFDTAGYTVGSASSPVITISSGSVTANVDATIVGAISTTAPLVKAGAGTLTLLGNNTIRTSLTINAGLVSFNAENALGAATNRIDLDGGGLRYAGSSALSLKSTRSVVVGAAGGTIDTATTLTLAGAGQLGGAGDLVKAGAQTLAILADNPDFSGNVTVNAGTLQLGSALAVNRAAVTLAGGVLYLRGGASTDMVRGVSVTGDAALDCGPLLLPVTGLVHSVGDVTVGGGATLTFTAHNGHTLAARDLDLAAGGGLRIVDTSVTVGGALGGGGGVFFGARKLVVPGGPDGLVLTGGGSRSTSVGLTADVNGVATLGLTNGTALAYDGAWTGNAAGAANAVNLAGGSAFVAGANARLNTLADDGASARAFVVTGTGPADTFELGEGFVADRGAGGTFAGLASLDVRGATLVTRSTAGLPLVTRGDGAGGTYRAGRIDFPAAPVAAAWDVAGADQRYDGGVSVAAPVTIRTDADLTHAGVATGRFDGQFQLGATDLTKTGPGTLRLAGDQGYAPGATIRVDDGTLRLDTDPTAGWYAGNYARGADGAITTAPVAARTLGVVVGSNAPAEATGLLVFGATAQFAAPLAGLASLTVNAGGTARLAGDSPAGGETLVIDALAVAPTGVVDLVSGRLVIDYAAGTPSPFADVARMADDGRLTGAASPDGERATAVGYAEASEVFRNVPVASRAFGNATGIDDTAVLARVTYVGDADLDGNVDFVDFLRFQVGYGQAGAHWSVGDFDCDGAVTTDDFLLLYDNLDPGSTTPAQQEALAAYAAALVPEPGCATWIVGAAMAVVRRGRRRGAA